MNSQLGPVNTGFELMESSGDDEIVETPFLVPGAFNLPNQDSCPSTRVTLAAGHFHTVAFDHSNDKLWTWGAGILGRGSEVYDPLPAPITFFGDGNVKVKEVYSSGDYSLAVGAQVANNSDRDLVFIWGYLPSDRWEAHQTMIKANFPIVVRDLACDNVRQLAAIPTGFSALIANPNSNTWRLKYFGSTLFKPNQSTPYYPYFQENAEQLHSYDVPPSINIHLPFQTPNDDPFCLTLGAGMAAILKSTRLLLIDLTSPEKLSVAGLTGIGSATLTDDGLCFIKTPTSEANLHLLPNSDITFSPLQAQQQSNLPTFDELVDGLSQGASPYSLPLDKDSHKVLKYEYGNIWTL